MISALLSPHITNGDPGGQPSPDSNCGQHFVAEQLTSASRGNTPPGPGCPPPDHPPGCGGERRRCYFDAWAALHNYLDDQLVKSNMRDWKTFMGGFSASSKFQGMILQSPDSRPPLAPYSPLSEGKGWGFQGGWGWPRENPGRQQGSGPGGPSRLPFGRASVRASPAVSSRLHGAPFIPHRGPGLGPLRRGSSEARGPRISMRDFEARPLDCVWVLGHLVHTG